MSEYLLGCLSTLFISHTVGVLSFPKFSGKFRLFISSQMFANLLNIHKIRSTPQQTGSPANHRLLAEKLILALSIPVQYDIILMSPSQRSTPQSFTNGCKCNKVHAVKSFSLNALQSQLCKKSIMKTIFSPMYLQLYISLQIVSLYWFCFLFVCGGGA